MTNTLIPCASARQISNGVLDGSQQERKRDSHTMLNFNGAVCTRHSVTIYDTHPSDCAT
jgi:hypothetical protein